MSARLASCLVCVVAAVAIAFPANAFDEKVDAANPFAGVLNVPAAGPTIAISGGNPGDPFEEGHPMESGLYKSLYYSHYHALFYDVNAPVLDKLPDANDARGHPLWFDGDRGDAALAALVTGLLERSQFADLDKLFQDWSNPSDRLADGRSKLLVYGFAISHLCQVSDCWASIHQTIQHWRETRKNSSAAALAEAIYWISYAWNARGYGYADTVDADAAAVFTERLQRAQGVLAESRPYAQGTLWTKLSIDVGKNLGLPQSRLAAIFAEQAQADHYNSAIYASMVLALTPKWGGNWHLVDAFINDAMRNTKDIEGTSMYARLYLEAVDPNVHLFGDTLASWPMMKKGFEDMAQRYPHSAFNLNRYAAVACMAEDKDTFQEVIFRLGNDVLPNLWPANHSFDLCMNKFKRQEL